MALLIAQDTALAQTAPLTSIPDVSVTSPPPGKPAEGSEAAGYKPDTVTNFGPFGQLPILDTPYSVNVISSDILENKLALSPEDVFRISPVVQVITPNDRTGTTSFSVRGFTGTAIAEDGIRVGGSSAGFYPIALEDKERVEIFTGLTSFLYGPTNVGGLINYVYKKPTNSPIYNVTLGDYGNQAGFVHGDFGGPIDKNGMFAYRFNFVLQDGNTPLQFQNETRALTTGVLDWHIAPDTTLEVMGTHNYQNLKGLGNFWSVSTAANGAALFHYGFIPSSTINYGQPWTSEGYEVERAEVNLTSKLNDIFTARLAYALTDNYNFASYQANNTLAANSDAGVYSQSQARAVSSQEIAHSGYGFIDAQFNTWSIQHQMTMGYYGNTFDVRVGAGSTTNLASTGNFFSQPIYDVQPAFRSTQNYYGEIYTTNITAQNNFIVGDDIKFNQYLSALVGANYAEIIARNFNNTPPFSQSSFYDQGKLSPSLSLIFKPVSWLSTYATYSQALEQGQIVPSTGAVTYTNAGSILPPFIDQEYELGAKANVGGMLLTAAFFQIDKALQYAVNNNNGTSTYVQSGRQENRGIELTATGNVTDGLRLLGGVTLLDAKVTNNQSNTALNGKEPLYTTPLLIKATMEYDLPFTFARGFTLTGGVYFNGEQPADAINSNFLPSYVTEDLGLRYRTNLPTGQQVIFRLNVSNITNKGYWLDPNTTGSPRTVAFSTQIKF